VSPVPKNLRAKALSPGPKKKTADTLRSSWPLVLELVRPRRACSRSACCLTLINSVCGIVTARLHQVPDRWRHHQASDETADSVGGCGSAGNVDSGRDLLFAHAIALQGGAASDRGNAPPRAAAHRPPAGGYYDANKTGVLVSRIMTDVEGVRNLVGTGLVDFVGGIMKALFSLAALVYISPLLTGDSAALYRGVRLRA
jgi:hypothetical protein